MMINKIFPKKLFEIEKWVIKLKIFNKTKFKN